MPQEIRVVKCFQCRVYQTDIVKKAKKWQCKLCGTKQSLLQEFCRGAGNVCREYAQKLNGKNATDDETQLEKAIALEEQLNQSQTTSTNSTDISNNEVIESSNNTSCNKQKTENKWSIYVEDNETTDDEDNIFH